jgi:hypothetical protein
MSPTSPSAGPQATICTVLTPAHLELGALNRRLAQALNPDTPVAWSVVYNPALHAPGAEPAEAEAALPPAVARAFPGAAVGLGPSLQAVFDQVFARPQPKGMDRRERRRLLLKFLGSYHHAAGLAAALARVRTRHAVIVDPDFYVLRRGWISEVLAAMADRDLAVFGAPWNPRWYQKYRGFPSTHLLILDLQAAPWAPGLLEPDLVGGGRRFGSDLWARYAAGAPGGGRALLRHPWRAATEDIRQRGSIGSARDTGYALMRAFRARPDLGVGLLQAAFAPEDGFMPPNVSWLQRHPLVEAALRDRFRYLPRGRAGWSRRGFADLGYPSFRHWGWEEFMWRDAPFAVHVRGELQRRPGGPGMDPDRIGAALSDMLARLGEPPLAPAGAADAVGA